MRRIHPEQQCVIEEMAAKEKEKKFVQAVEALPEPVCAHDKAFILLVYKGLRPGMILPLKLFSLPPGAERRGPTVEELMVYNQTRSVCSEFGIVAEPVESPFFPNDDESEDFCKHLIIAKNQETVDQFMKPWKKFVHPDEQGRDPEDERLIGYLMGFPPTAVNAYTELVRDHTPENKQRLLLDMATLPDELKQQDYMAFAALALSKGNWKNELNTIRSWAKEVKRMSPSIYNSAVGAYRKILEGSELKNRKFQARKHQAPRRRHLLKGRNNHLGTWNLITICWFFLS
ncbi:MAG: hypothetical protein UX09_C0021G0004 [Candidatus Uhrbacteria bacterium GW2011_GWE2_45_35]|uniref:Uncharacterized protein n=1 Tax=Candidatus Uhrbacteria bacterium GW2011_GWE2_45_35 TaxID=1618993 RepID=A0A0G1QH84_9BACT|nr:MAG: hypothetical protein UX09_C0021G0004 [Candidatus Uhrbacteria bacterium GW2011_GWE2_45_35]